MENNFANYVDIVKLQKLFDDFYEATGILTVISDFDGNSLVFTRTLNDICYEFQMDGDPCRNPNIFDPDIDSKANYKIYQCQHGFVYAAAAVTVNKKHLVNMYIGPVLYEKPDLEYYKKEAEKFGISINGYLEMLKLIPVITTKMLKGHIKYCLQLINTMIELRTEVMEHTRRERKLRESEKVYRDLVELSSDMILIHSEGKIIYVNSAGIRMLEAEKAEDLIGNPVLDIVHKDYREYVKQRREKLYLGEIKEALIEEKLIKMDGKTIIDVEGTTTRFNYKNKAAVKVALRNITERKRAEELYHALFNSSTIGIYIVQDSKFKFINPLLKEVTEYGDELLGQNIFTMVPPEEKKIVKENAVKMLKGERISPYEFSIKTKNGKTKYIMEKVIPIQYEGKRAALSNFMDITNLKKAEKAREESEQTLADIINFLPDATFVIDRNGKVISWNRAIEEMTGIKAKDILGKNNYEYAIPFYGARRPILIDLVFHSDEEIEKNYHFIQRSKEGIVAETPTPYVKGKTVFMWAKATPLYDTNGNIVGAIESIRDITERKEFEEALQRSEANYRTIFETSGTAMIIYGEDMTISLANSEFAQLSGYKKDEIQDKMKWVEFIALPDRDKMVKNHNTRKFNNEIPKSYEVQFIDRDGFVKDVILTVSLIPGGSKRVASFMDITERKTMEEELVRSGKLESVGILAGGIAHDFNNILTVITGNTSLAKITTDPDDEIYELLSQIDIAAHQARDLTQQLLTFSKGGAPIKQTASIPELLKETASFSLRGSNVRCEFNIPDNLWPVRVDKGQISQVINNLIINANQAMADGGIIEMMAENVDINVDYPLPVDGRKFVKIAIKDNGIGIPEKHLAKIFDPYFTTKQKGHGLGLSTCYFIIQKHDGYITVDSEPGVGTTFSIYLPASPKQVLKKKDLKKSIMAGQGKILVMDDEEFIRTMVCRMLTQLGYKAEAAKDGAEAIAIYKHARRLNQGFNAVIMDLTIAGGMGGREAIKKLLEVDPNAKVIVSSGYSNDPVMANYKKYGFCGIIPKPYNIENLYKILSETITNSA